jgi:hypothetical protein
MRAATAAARGCDAAWRGEGNTVQISPSLIFYHPGVMLPLYFRYLIFPFFFFLYILELISTAL